MCKHQTDTQPSCPGPYAIDCEAALVVAHDVLTGYSLLCNGVILMPDTGGLYPNGAEIPPHRGVALHTTSHS